MPPPHTTTQQTPRGLHLSQGSKRQGQTAGHAISLYLVFYLEVASLLSQDDGQQIEHRAHFLVFPPQHLHEDVVRLPEEGKDRS